MINENSSSCAVSIARQATSRCRHRNSAWIQADYSGLFSFFIRRMQTICNAPPRIRASVGERSEYAAKVSAVAIRENTLKVPPTVKSYFTTKQGPSI